jgi:hypothetical protein
MVALGRLNGVDFCPATTDRASASKCAPKPDEFLPTQ